MFSGDDDLGVFDDDFLCEVFHPAGHGVGGGGGGEERDPNPPPPPPQSNILTNQNCDPSNDSQPEHSSPPNLILTNHVQDNQTRDQSAADTHLIPDGDVLDDFFSDLGDLEDDLTTPPDHAFTQPHGKENCVKSTSGQDDFRARILKAIEGAGHEASSDRFNVRKRKEEEEEMRRLKEKTQKEYRNYHVPVNPIVSHTSNNSTGVTRPSSMSHKRKTDSSVQPLVQKRKFPGPAGLLPQMGQPRSEVPSKETEKANTTNKEPLVVCSQTCVDDYASGPWQKMIHDLELDPTDPTGPLGVFSVRWVVRRAGLRGGAGVRRVPFLAVKVKSLDVTQSYPTVTLRDPTDEIKGTIATPVLQDLGHTLTPGAVLVLRGVTVLSPGAAREPRSPRPRRHYLNITRSTIIAIYTPDESGGITTTNLRTLDRGELRREAAAPTGVCGPCAIIEEEEEENVEDSARGGVPKQSGNSGSLFSHVSGGTTSAGVSKACSVSGRSAGVPQRRGVPPAVPQGRGVAAGVPRVPGYGSDIRLQAPYRMPPSGNVSQPPRPPPPSPVSHRHNTPASRPPTSVQHPTSQSYRPSTPTHNLNTQGSRPNSQYMQNPLSFQQNTIPQSQKHSSLPLKPSPMQQKPSFHPNRPSFNLCSPSHPPARPPAPDTSFNTSMFSSQAEEEEVKVLLEGLDEDSLFGDF